MAYKDIYQDFLKMDWESRVEQAVMSLEVLRKACKKKKMSEDDTNYLFFSLFSLFMIFDGKGNETERKFFCDVFDYEISDNEFEDVMELSKVEGFLPEIKNLVDAMKRKPRYDVIILGVCIATCDGLVSPDLQELVDYLLLKEK